MYSESDAQFLKRAALIDAMYEIVDPGQNLDPKRVNTETAVQLFDELVKAGADVNAPPPVKRDLQMEQTVGRIAEATFLGKVASSAYWDTYWEGRVKIAQGMRGLIDKIRGGTAEESLERKIKLDSLKRQRDEGQRRHELGIRPDELGLAEQEGAQGETTKKRELGLKELEQRQGMAEELRQLQIADQYAKRSREKRLFERLHGGSALGSAAGGGIAGAAIGRLLGKPGGIPIGIAAGLGLNALTGKDRALAQLEKERVMPRSMQSEVVP